jgi:hypothetical protein
LRDLLRAFNLPGLCAPLRMECADMWFDLKQVPGSEPYEKLLTRKRKEYTQLLEVSKQKGKTSIPILPVFSALLSICAPAEGNYAVIQS